MPTMTDDETLALARVAAVRALHTRCSHAGCSAAENGTDSCHHDGLPWPCPTIDAVGGEPVSRTVRVPNLSRVYGSPRWSPPDGVVYLLAGLMFVLAIVAVSR